MTYKLIYINSFPFPPHIIAHLINRKYKHEELNHIIRFKLWNDQMMIENMPAKIKGPINVRYVYRPFRSIFVMKFTMENNFLSSVDWH